MTSRPADVPDWALERYRLGELSAEESERVRQALASDDALRARAALLERSDGEILERHPPAVLAAAIRARGDASPAPQRAPWRLPRALAVLGAAAAVAAVAVLAPTARAPHTADETRIKGLAPKLLVFRETPPAAAEMLVSGSVARENDVVQLAYQAAGRRFGAIVSVDARGVVTRHLPESGSHAARLKPGGPTALAHAYRLDDAPGFERFYLVTARETFSVDEVVAAVRGQAGEAGGGLLPLPPGLDQSTFVLKKEAVP
jgi:anti-sigma factor RsiW